jgi:hypothetical protein
LEDIGVDALGRIDVEVLDESVEEDGVIVEMWKVQRKGRRTYRLRVRHMTIHSGKVQCFFHLIRIGMNMIMHNESVPSENVMELVKSSPIEPQP